MSISTHRVIILVLLLDIFFFTMLGFNAYSDVGSFLSELDQRNTDLESWRAGAAEGSLNVTQDTSTNYQDVPIVNAVKMGGNLVGLIFSGVKISAMRTCSTGNCSNLSWWVLVSLTTLFILIINAYAILEAYLLVVNKKS